MLSVGPAGAIVIASAIDAKAPVLSVARSTNVLTPDVPGVPAIEPSGLRLKPSGRLEDARDQVTAPMPVALIDAE